jgi:hypothetical protein
MVVSPLKLFSRFIRFFWCGPRYPESEKCRLDRRPGSFFR